MPLDLDSTGNERTRWVSLDGHLAGVDILVRSVTPAEARRFYNRLQSQGIVKANKDNPLDVAPGRETAFFRAMAEQYVIDWRGDITPKDAPYSIDKMGAVLGAYSRAFSALLAAIGEEDAFFESRPERPTSN